MPNNPTWIEPPPPQAPRGLGCVAKSCLGLLALGALVILLLGVGGYFFFSRVVISPQPAALPVEELSPEALSDVRQRVEEFKSAPPSPSSTPVEAEPPGETATATPAPVAPAPEHQLVVSAGEINGMISANRKSRGHAFVSLSGNTANVQISIPSDKVPGFPHGYLNGSFNITTDGPTPVTGLQVSKIQANGYPVPSSVLSMSYRGESILGIALDAIAPYNVSTAEVRDGKIVLH